MGESDNMTDKKTEEVGDNFSDHSSSQTVVFEDISQNSAPNFSCATSKQFSTFNFPFTNSGIVLCERLEAPLENFAENSENTSANDNSDTDRSEDWKKSYSTSSLMLSPSRKELKEEDSEEDTSSNDEWNKTPRVGGDYQVYDIPSVNRQKPDYDDRTDELLWDPKSVTSVKVENYLAIVNDLIAPSRSAPTNRFVRDNEDALLLLRQCNNDVAEALRRVRFRPPPLASEMNVWSKEECRQFEHGLTLYGKDFHTIHHNKVKTKSVGEIVKFYYIWKKSQQQVKTRLGKKKEAAQTADYVEKLLDETDSSQASPLSLRIPAQHQTTRLESLSNHKTSLQTPFNDFLGLSDLAQGEEYLKDSDILDHITPTLPVDGDYVPPALSEIDPAIFVVYSDPGNLAPIANTIVHCEVELGGEVYTSSQTCQVSPSHRLTPRSGSHDFSSPLDGERNESSRRDSTNSTLPEDVLSSIDELETTYCTSSDSDSNLNQVSSNSIALTSPPHSFYPCRETFTEKDLGKSGPSSRVHYSSPLVVGSHAKSENNRRSSFKNQTHSVPASNSNNSSQCDLSTTGINEVSGKLIC